MGVEPNMTIIDSRKVSSRAAREQLPVAGSSIVRAHPDHGNPWEAKFSDPADIEKVRRTVGRHFNRPLYWIPGVVLIAVRKAEDFEESLTELRAALGTEGLSTGILLLFPGSSRPQHLSREMLAHGRIRVQTADETLLKQSFRDEDDLVEKIVRSTLGRLGSASAAWLRGRTRQLALTSHARPT